jgi:sRNA-binding carbon storage regulator CsrA
MLKLDLRVGETVAIGEFARITVEAKSGKLARLAIQADRNVPIRRIGSATPASFAATSGITGKNNS